MVEFVPRDPRLTPDEDFMLRVHPLLSEVTGAVRVYDWEGRVTGWDVTTIWFEE